MIANQNKRLRTKSYDYSGLCTYAKTRQLNLKNYFENMFIQIKIYCQAVYKVSLSF